MQSCRREVTKRIAIAGAGLSSLLCLMMAARAAAQDERASAGAGQEILAEFEAMWNDESWEPTEGRAERYMRPLDDVGWKARVAAFRQIVRHGALGVPELFSALESESVPIRALAAQALGYCGNKNAKPALAQLVEHDSDAMVRLYAADSLGMLGGRDHDALLRRLEPDESNRDTKRHIGYALDREGAKLDPGVTARLRNWSIAALGSAALHQPAPDFELESLAGETIRLGQFRGKKIVALVFIYGDT